MVEIYDKNKNLVEKTKRQIGKVTIPSIASEIISLRLETPKPGGYYAKVALTLGAEITGDGKETILSSYYSFNLREKEPKTKLSGSAITGFEKVHIKGNESGPYVTQGYNTTSDLTLRLDSELSGKSRLKSLLFLRYADDDLVYLMPLSIEQFYIKYLSDNLDLTLGDLYAEFTDFTLSESLEGISASAKSDRFNLTGVISRLWEEGNDQQYTRYVSGIRPEFSLIKKNEDGAISDFDVGFNYIVTEDDSSTLDDAYASGVSDLENKVYGIDANIKFNNNWKVYSEYTESRNDADTKDSVPGKVGSAFNWIPAMETKS